MNKQRKNRSFRKVRAISCACGANTCATANIIKLQCYKFGWAKNRAVINEVLAEWQIPCSEDEFQLKNSKKCFFSNIYLIAFFLQGSYLTQVKVDWNYFMVVGIELSRYKNGDLIAFYSIDYKDKIKCLVYIYSQHARNMDNQ